MPKTKDKDVDQFAIRFDAVAHVGMGIGLFWLLQQIPDEVLFISNREDVTLFKIVLGWPTPMPILLSGAYLVCTSILSWSVIYRGLTGRNWFTKKLVPNPNPKNWV